MKIALVTIHNANNYGAVLQTYALQKILSQYGDVMIIDYDNRHITTDSDLIRIRFSFRGVLGIGKDVVRLFPRYSALKKNIQFAAKNIKHTKKLSAEELYHGHAGDFDVYIVGSDQVWNPACISGNCSLDSVYFLNFAPKEAKKISYGSSIGSHIYSQEEKKHIKELLKDFDMVSVREKDGKIMLQEILERSVNHVLDPSLLLSKNDWLEGLGIKDLPIKHEKYILLYIASKNSLANMCVEYFSKKIGLKIVAIDQGLRTFGKADTHIRDAGPLDFLQLFNNAEFVITDSFHGTCFSVNFQKPFVTIAPGKHSNRIESLLSLIGLEERMVKDKKEFSNLDIEFNFEDVTKKLIKHKHESLSILSGAFQAC